MRILPAIDIIDGKCVRLTRGNYSTKKVYNEKPLEVAKEFEDNGFKVEEVYSDVAGKVFNPASAEIAIVAKKI